MRNVAQALAHNRCSLQAVLLPSLLCCYEAAEYLTEWRLDVMAAGMIHIEGKMGNRKVSPLRGLWKVAEMEGCCVRWMVGEGTVAQEVIREQ